MGAIFRVRHRLLDEVRVMKIMKPQAAQSDELRRRFLREAQTVTRLKHPNIVTVHDLIVDDDHTAYMIMEYVEGISLSELIGRLGKVPASVTLELSRQSLAALGYLHRKGIVHRDVSPDNIMIAREDGEIRVKLIDLGIAKVARAEENLTATDQFLGKLRYASPEQLNRSIGSGEIDGRSDLYSFGAVIFELLTGERLIPDGSVHAILSAHMSGHVTRLREVETRAVIAPEVQSVVARALQPDPANRFATAEEFSKSLEALHFSPPGPEELRRIEGYLEHFSGPEPGGSEDPTRNDSRQMTTPRTRSEEATVDIAAATTRAAAQATKPIATAAPRRLGFAFWTTIGAGAAAVGVAGAVFLWKARQPTPSEVGHASAARLELPASSPATTKPAPPPAVTARPSVDRAASKADLSVAPPPHTSANPAQGKHEEHKTAAPPAAVPPLVPASVNPGTFCAEIDPTAYVQGVLKESAEGFASDSGQSFRAPRTDAARIQVRLSLAPPQPREGEPFVVTARLVNGGDSDLDVERVEESAPGTPGGYLAVGGTRIPATLNIGGSIEIYRAQAVLRAGGSYFKSLRITDADGDSWKTSLRLAACPQS